MFWVTPSRGWEAGLHEWRSLGAHANRPCLPASSKDEGAPVPNEGMEMGAVASYHHLVEANGGGGRVAYLPFPEF